MKTLNKISIPFFIIFSVLMVMMAFGIGYVFLCGESMDAYRASLEDSVDASSVAYWYLAKITFDKRIIFTIVFFISIFMSFIRFKKAPFISSIFMIVVTISPIILFTLALNCYSAGSIKEGIQSSTLLLLVFPILFLAFYFPSVAFSVLALKRLEEIKVQPSNKQKDIKPIDNQKPLSSSLNKESASKPVVEQQKEMPSEVVNDEINQRNIVLEEPLKQEKSINNEKHSIGNTNVASNDNMLERNVGENADKIKEESVSEVIRESKPLQESKIVEEETIFVPKENIEETKHIEEVTIENKPIEPVQQAMTIQPQPKPHKKISVDEYIRLFQSDLIMADLNNKYIIPKKKKNDGGIRWDSFEQGMIVSLDEQIKDIPAKTEGVVLGINRDYTVDIGFIIRGKKVILAAAARQLSIKEN